VQDHRAHEKARRLHPMVFVRLAASQWQTGEVRATTSQGGSA
jgi:hypothetical protein